jgi:hypothetical protein
MPAIFIYQILNHYTKPGDLDPGFLVLDNSSNERPDWFEYWPIRKFLLSEPLDEESFYGFLSPKFKYKTNLSAAAGGIQGPVSSGQQIRQALKLADPDRHSIRFQNHPGMRGSPLILLDENRETLSPWEARRRLCRSNPTAPLAFHL